MQTIAALLTRAGEPPVPYVLRPLQVGDIVLAIGNPFAVGQTVTHGIVSAVARTQVGLPTVLVRALARSHEWRARWQAITQSGAAPFEGTSANWDRNKLNLIYWSKFYDNILSHPEAPDESVVNDDDALNTVIKLIRETTQINGPWAAFASDYPP